MAARTSSAGASFSTNCSRGGGHFVVTPGRTSCDGWPAWKPARLDSGTTPSPRTWRAAAGDTFPVGLIYGPSGCGKSSLVKAGLLPRLAQSATAVYVEATAEDTEARLLKGLRRHVPDLPGVSVWSRRWQPYARGAAWT